MDGVKSMSDISWIKDLVQFEKQMEESGMIDMQAGFDAHREIIRQSIDFMTELKNSFMDSASVFNQLKGEGLGSIKTYGISNTQADFMLFRNGFKLIFSLVEAGKIIITTRNPSGNITPGSFVGATSNANPEAASQEMLMAQWGAFGELKWVYQNQAVNLDFLVRYYLSRFIRESAK